MNEGDAYTKAGQFIYQEDDGDEIVGPKAQYSALSGGKVKTENGV